MPLCCGLFTAGPQTVLELFGGLVLICTACLREEICFNLKGVGNVVLLLYFHNPTERKNPCLSSEKRLQRNNLEPF